MNNTKLKRWAELLLDTGKRNRLVSYKDTKYDTLEVVYPDTSTLFDKVGGTASFEAFDPKLKREEFEDTEVESTQHVKISRDEFLKARYYFIMLLV